MIPADLQRLPAAPRRTRYKAVLRGPNYRPQRYVVGRDYLKNLPGDLSAPGTTTDRTCVERPADPCGRVCSSVFAEHRPTCGSAEISNPESHER